MSVIFPESVEDPRDRIYNQIKGAYFQPATIKPIDHAL